MEGELRCYNPNCRRPLNNYAFSANNGTKQLFCTASCYRTYTREQQWLRRSIERAQLLASFCVQTGGAIYDGEQQEPTQAQAVKAEIAIAAVAIAATLAGLIQGLI